GLASSVGAQDDDDFPRFDREVEPVHRLHAGVRDTETGDLEGWIHPVYSAHLAPPPHGLPTMMMPYWSPSTFVRFCGPKTYLPRAPSTAFPASSHALRSSPVALGLAVSAALMRSMAS